MGVEERRFNAASIPIKRQSLNFYVYEEDNPLFQADPYGHCCWDKMVQGKKDHPRTMQAVGIVGFAYGTGSSFALQSGLIHLPMFETKYLAPK